MTTATVSNAGLHNPIQGQWTEILCCCVCGHIFDENFHEPVNLSCGHTACRVCLRKLRSDQCPFDQCVITVPLESLPVNTCLLKILGKQAVSTWKDRASWRELFESEDEISSYESCIRHLEKLANFFKRAQSERGGSVWSTEVSRPMQRKLVPLLCCQLVEPEGRVKAVKIARSLGERALTELLLLHQNTNHLSSNLWSAVRARGCQFLGPAMQEEVLKLILLTLSEGALIARKTLVLYIVQMLEKEYPQSSKTSVGHVVQLLYRASCFNVIKRDGESSLMQLKEDLRNYDALRREHDAQIVHIAMESGLRISPDQWSALLYGDQAHRSHMQSIIDKLQSPLSFGQSIQELVVALQRTGDPGGIGTLVQYLELLASVEVLQDGEDVGLKYLNGVIESVTLLLEGQVKFCHNHSGNNRAGTSRIHRDSGEASNPGHPSQISPTAVGSHNQHSEMGQSKGRGAVPAPSLAHVRPVASSNPYKYKITLCRDAASDRRCPRGENCTFAHSYEEMNEHRRRVHKNQGQDEPVIPLMEISPPRNHPSVQPRAVDLVAPRAINLAAPAGAIGIPPSPVNLVAPSQPIQQPVSTPQGIIPPAQTPIMVHYQQHMRKGGPCAGGVFNDPFIGAIYQQTAVLNPQQQQLPQAQPQPPATRFLVPFPTNFTGGLNPCTFWSPFGVAHNGVPVGIPVPSPGGSAQGTVVIQEGRGDQIGDSAEMPNNNAVVEFPGTIPIFPTRFADLQSHLTQLKMKRAEINRRLNEISGYDRDHWEPDENDPTYQLSYTVATSVLDSDAPNPVRNFPIPSGSVHVSRRSQSPHTDTVTSMRNSVANTSLPAVVADTVGRQPIHITTVRTQIQTHRANFAALEKTPPTNVISPASYCIMKDTLSQPVFTPSLQPMHTTPLVSFDSVDPSNMTWNLPPMIKGPSPVLAQSAITHGIDKIVEIKERIGEMDALGIHCQAGSAVEKKQLRMELDIVNKNIDSLDKQTEEDCLIRELESVNLNINQLEKNY